MANYQREGEAEGRLPARVHTGSDPDRKKGRSTVPSLPPPTEVAHDPVHASYNALDQLLVFLLERAKGDDGYELQAIRESLHGSALP